MKKIIVLVLLATIVLCGCNRGQKNENTEGYQSEVYSENESEIETEIIEETEWSTQVGTNTEISCDTEVEQNTETNPSVETEIESTLTSESDNNKTPSNTETGANSGASTENKPTTYPDCPYTLFEATYSDEFFYFYHDGTEAGYFAGYNSVSELLKSMLDELSTQYPAGTSFGISVENDTYEIMGDYKNISPNIPDSEYMRVVYIKTPLLIKVPEQPLEPELVPCPHKLNTITKDPFSAEFFYLETEDPAVVAELAAEALSYVQSQRQMYIEQGRSEEEVQLVRIEGAKVGDYKEGAVYKYTYGVYIP